MRVDVIKTLYECEAGLFNNEEKVKKTNYPILIGEAFLKNWNQHRRAVAKN